MEPPRNLILEAAAGLGCDCHSGGDPDRVRLLVERGAPWPEASAETARGMARLAKAGRIELLRLLLDGGVSPGVMVDPDENARRRSVERDLLESSLEAVESVFPEGASDARSPLDILMRPLEKNPERAMAFEIPLHQAASGGSAEGIRLLIAAGADAQVVDSSGGSPLFEARSAEAVRALVEAGVRVDVTNTFGYDAARELLSNLTDECPIEERDAIEATLREMFACGVPLVLPSGIGRNRLYDAAFEVSPRAVRYLLHCGHPVDADSHGRTALHAVCWPSDRDDEPSDDAEQRRYSAKRRRAISEIIGLLIDAGVEPNARDDRGNTPLHEAAAGDGASLSAISALAEAGADPNAQNIDGDTPLHVAYSCGFEYGRVVPAMIALGADPRIGNRHGESVTDIARSMIRGEEPRWRIEHLKTLPADHPAHTTGWKTEAVPGDEEYLMLKTLEDRAEELDRTGKQAVSSVR